MGMNMEVWTGPFHPLGVVVVTKLVLRVPDNATRNEAILSIY